MKKILLAAAAVAALSLPASAQGLGEKTGINKLTGAAPSTEDFVKMTGQTNLLEIEAGKLAQQRADEGSKKLGQTLVDDHGKMNEELKQAAAGSNVQVPAQLDSTHQSKLDKLKDLQGADFDKEYDKMMHDGHKTDVSVFERYSKEGDNAKLKAFAAKFLPILQGHLKTAEAEHNKH